MVVVRIFPTVVYVVVLPDDLVLKGTIALVDQFRLKDNEQKSVSNTMMMTTKKNSKDSDEDEEDNIQYYIDDNDDDDDP